MDDTPSSSASPSGGDGRFGSILDHLREGVQVLDRDWRYLYVNEAAARHGRRTREELIGRTLPEMYPGVESSAMFTMLERCMRERVPAEMENEFTFADGSSAWFELRVQPVAEGIFVLSVDIQERKSLEAQLRHAQKMEAVGRLAGGIAHDFNNILTAISSFAEFAHEALDADSRARQDVAEIAAAAKRAESLVAQLLAFSRGRGVRPRPMDISERVADLDAMLRRVLGDDIEMETTMAPGSWTVEIDGSALEQVLVNLAVNARDAMPDGGRLEIETANVELDDSYSMTKGGAVVPGEYVVLSVSDNGVGMDAVTQAHIFEPFYTTKPRGVGTGLGLSTCYGIVKQAGGYIWVYSEPGRGSTFKIYLPRVHGEVERRTARELVSADHRGTESILVVEDDPLVRALAVRALRARGYTVLAAGDAAEAMQIAAGGQPIDLLLSDVVMPRTSGAELAGRLMAERPGLKVLFMSGYTEGAIVHQGILERGVSLIAKPFTPQSLAHRVREVLDADTPGS